MKLEQQVCSLELANRLKELGVRQASYFVWLFNDNRSQVAPPGSFHGWADHEMCSAFTVAELGEMLPPLNDTQKWENRQAKFCCYHIEKDGTKDHAEWADTEADARAKMLLYLIEHGIIKL